MPRGVRGIPCQIRIPRRRNSAEYRVVYGIIFSSDPWYSAVFYGNPRYYTVFRGIPTFLKKVQISQKTSKISKKTQNFKKVQDFQKSSKFSEKLEISRKTRNRYSKSKLKTRNRSSKLEIKTRNGKISKLNNRNISQKLKFGIELNS